MLIYDVFAETACKSRSIYRCYTGCDRNCTNGLIISVTIAFSDTITASSILSNSCHSTTFYGNISNRNGIRIMCITTSDTGSLCYSCCVDSSAFDNNITTALGRIVSTIRVITTVESDTGALVSSCSIQNAVSVYRKCRIRSTDSYACMVH